MSSGGGRRATIQNCVTSLTVGHVAYVVGLCGTYTGPHGRLKAYDDIKIGLNIETISSLG
jgi:hypothetical protein